VLEDALPLWTASLPDTPIAWLVGSEGQGLLTAAAAAADVRVRIALAAGVGSLNVASAAAVGLFERQRRRTA
jgi:tRNA G18 (ribose-2'-O)-methylase SpoU